MQFVEDTRKSDGLEAGLKKKKKTDNCLPKHGQNMVNTSVSGPLKPFSHFL